MFFYRVEICVRTLPVEGFVAVHHCDEVLSLGKVDDVVGIAWKHDDTLYPVSADFVVEYLVRAFLAELDESVAGDDDEQFPLGVVPVLSLGDAGLGYVYGYLPAVEGVDKLCEAAPVVGVHVQVVYGLLLGQVAQVCAEQAFREAVGRHVRYQEGLRHVREPVKQVDYFSQLYVMRKRCCAVASVGLYYGLHAVELAAVFPALQGAYHFLHQVVDVEQFHVHVRVIDLDGKAVGYVVAECGHGAVVVGPAPFAVQVGETVDQHLRPCLPAVTEEQFFSGLLALAVFRCAETAGKGGLDAGTEHHGTPVAVSLEGIQ